MQLKKLYIEDYKILKDFTIEFPYDFKKYISVFIGANGSGKSTILETIAQIFSSAMLNEKAKFGFELEYSVRLENITEETFNNSEFHIAYILVKLKAYEGEEIKVSIDSGMDDTNYDDKIVFDKNKVIVNEGSKQVVLSYLPDNIIVYYSGLSEHLENVCNKHELQQQEAFYKGNLFAKRSFFYYKPENFNMLLLALLSFEFGDIKEKIFKKLNITELSGFSIKMKRPNTSWAKSKKAKDVWGAKGVILEFCEVLQRFAKFTHIAEDDNSIDFSFPSMERLYSIKNHYGDERKLFELLDMSLYEGMLDSIEITLNKGVLQTKSIPQDGKINFNSKRLSEGEQQSIIIKGLTELFSGKNSLFLFDEPDTYLHPKWQRQIITEIENTIDASYNSENFYVIATHSPQILSNARSELNFVKIIEDGALIENTPKYYGREINTILYELMGVEERNKLIRDKISDLYTLIDEDEIKDAESSLNELQDLIGEDDPELKRAEIQITYLKEDE